MTIVNGSLPFSQNYMKIHQDPTEKRFHLTLPHEIQRLSRQMRTPRSATRNSKVIPSNAYPPLCHTKFKGYPVKCVPHSVTWILHGIYGSVIAEAGKKHYDSDVHKRG